MVQISFLSPLNIIISYFHDFVNNIFNSAVGNGYFVFYNGVILQRTNVLVSNVSSKVAFAVIYPIANNPTYLVIPSVITGTATFVDYRCEIVNDWSSNTQCTAILNTASGTKFFIFGKK